MNPRPPLALAGLALALAGVTGCASSSAGSSASTSSEAITPGMAVGGAGHTDSAASAASAGSAGSAGSSGSSGSAGNAPMRAPQAGDLARPAPDLLARRVISTGSLTMVSTDVPRARARILRDLATWRGWVADEQTSSDRRGVLTRTELTLRIPSARFDAAYAGLAADARTLQQSRSAEDVTTQVIDVDTRVRAKQRAVAQLERLLSRATTLGQVIRLEGDISDRQAELQSLQRQQAYLRDQTSLSTITVDLSRQAPVTRPAHHAGVLGGLRAGLHALGAVALAALTALAAITPFAVVAAVIAVPVLMLRRRRRLT